MARKKRTSASEGTSPSSSLMKTSEVLEKSGITRQMLYLYSTMGLIDAAETTPAGHRLYDASVLTKLRIIRDALETGYSLRDVKETYFDPARLRERKKK